MTDEAGLSPAHTAAGRLQRALLERLYAHEEEGTLPTSGRFLFYELVQAGIVPKAATGKRRPDQNTSEALTRLREVGLVPWDWIVDETRELTWWRTASSVAEYVTDEVAHASLDRWNGWPGPLILCESRSLAGALRDLASGYACPIASTNGQARGFLVSKVAPTIGATQRVLYLGDWDWQGRQIEEATRRTLIEHSGLRGDQLARRWERVALTEAQVRDNDLPIIQKPDHRYRPVRHYEAVETEAFGQAAIVAAVQARLDALMPEPLEDVLVREARERAEVAERLRGLQ
jgi:hypothetical protein